MNTTETFYEILSDYEYVSFDIFDTLLYRTVEHAYDQLAFIPILLTRRYRISVDNFVKERLLAESSARKENPKSDVTLEMIYKKMPFTNELAKKLMELECEVELKCCYPNSIMINIVQWCKTHGKRIIITTDMYLPRYIIESMLKKIGVDYDRLFISSEEGATKNEGSLFKIILKKLRISNKQIIHIGDNALNDISRANEHGIKALLRIENELPQLRYAPAKRKDIGKQHIASLLQRGMQNINNDIPETHIGYTIIGPMLFEFCTWLHKQKHDLKLDSLLFVAREGYLIMRCYNIMYPDEAKSTKYARLNKNLLRLPLLLKEDPIKNFLKGIIVCHEYSWRLILKFFHIENKEKAVEELQNLGFTINLDDTILRKDIENGTYDKEIMAIISLQEDVIHKQEDLLLQYIKQLDIPGKRIGMVNNSFNGNGQYMVEQFLNSYNIPSYIHGLQFYVRSKCVEKLGNRCSGFISEMNAPLYVKELIAGSSLIMEHLLFEHTGTALTYKKNTEGLIYAVCEKPRKEILDYPALSILQNSAIKFIKDANKSLLLPLDKFGYFSFYNLLRNPKNRELSFICNLWDDDDDGDRHIVNTNSSNVDIKAVFQFLYRNDWPIGYMKFHNVPKFIIWLFFQRWRIAYYKHSLHLLAKDIKYGFVYPFKN